MFSLYFFFLCSCFGIKATYFEQTKNKCNKLGIIYFFKKVTIFFKKKYLKRLNCNSMAHAVKIRGEKLKAVSNIRED